MGDGEKMCEAATAVVPGHVTAFFSIHRRVEPARTGSRGAGLALSDGATVTREQGTERSGVTVFPRDRQRLSP